MVEAVKRLAQADRRQLRGVTDIDTPNRPFDNVEDSTFGGVGWALGYWEEKTI